METEVIVVRYWVVGSRERNAAFLVALSLFGWLSDAVCSGLLPPRPGVREEAASERR